MGADADITVFGPGRLIDRATYEKPAHPWCEYADQQVSGTIIEITNSARKLANLGLRELPCLTLELRSRTWN